MDTTRALIAARLEALRAQQADGLEMLAQLQAQTREMQEQLLRLAGAIQLCEDLLLTDQP